MQQIRWVWERMKGFQGLYIVALCTTVVLQAMMLINPILSQRIVDEVVMQLPGTEDLQPLVKALTGLILAMILFTVGRTVLRYFSLALYDICGQRFLFGVKKELYDKLQNQDMGFYSHHRTGDLMTCLTGDLEMGKHAIAFILRCLLECLFIFALSTCYMLSKDPLFALAMLVVTPFIFLLSRRFSKQVGQSFRDLREKLSLLNSFAQENIAGNRVVRAFAREEREMEEFDKKNREYREANLQVNYIWLRFFPAIEGLSQILPVVVLVVGGCFMMAGRITAGTFMAFNSLCWTISTPMRMLGMLLNDAQRFFVSTQKVMEVYYNRPRIASKAGAVTVEGPLKGEIDFSHVDVTLHGQAILKDITLHIAPGETLAIMGSTGSGKTTLVNSIARFLDVSGGSLTIDGVEVRDYDLDTLRSNIGIAHQEVFLFSDTIDGNIAYGNLELTEEEVRDFARRAGAHRFIEGTSDGYDTIIGERGTGLSGGQKQRLALARALAVRPSVLILDDTTSALDLETEQYIQGQLRDLDFPCTKIMVAQRISTTKNADKIVVMDEGRIIEQGTHKELLAQKGYYYEVFCLQNGNPEQEAV